MVSVKQYVVLLSLSVMAGLGFAQDLIYHCKVKQVLAVSSNGRLVPVKVYGPAVNDDFVIDRISGEIKGESISTRFATIKNIVDVGGREALGNNFKLTGVIEHWHPTVFYFEVQDLDNRRGVEARKGEYPFSGFYKYWHIAGTCR